jgi:hypothetical protein
MKIRTVVPVVLAAITLASSTLAQTAGKPGGDELVVVKDGTSSAIVVVSPSAGQWEKQAAADLQKYVEMMSGAKLALAGTADAIAGALKGKDPVLIVGQEALKADPSLQKALAATAKKSPCLRADAIAVRRKDNRVFIAGANDESHYYAAAWLLMQWGCRWYLPTDLGECVPENRTLKVGALDFSYGPPFEIRHYWLSWNGNGNGATEFQRRNFMSTVNIAGMGHSLGKYTKELVPEGKSIFNVPFTEEKTAQHVASKIEAEYAKGDGGISLAIEDGSYDTGSARDKEFTVNLYDKYMLRESLTDAMMEFYNKVARILREKHPASKTWLGGMAYTNVTIPPQRDFKPESSLVMWIAPIDIDPIHGMDDVESPPRQEYREMMRRWASIMQGRLVIYDYDQGMLVWRDLPNPCHFGMQQDMKHYRKAGILGIGTESRGASATTFLNLYFRGQLMWNPDIDVDAMMTEFYPSFFGPAAEPMKAYWESIYTAWKKTIVTEHEYFLIPAIYTPALVAELKKNLEAAEAAIKPLRGKANATRNEKLYVSRMDFVRLGFDVLDSYVAMATAAATEADYKAAVQHGTRGLDAREKLTAMNPIFTTYKNIGENGPAWWPGEVEQYRALAALTDGSKGTLLAKTPVEWAYHRDPRDTGLASGWALQTPDLSFWKANKDKFTVEARKDYPTTEWEMLRTDLYAQAQGIRHPDRQSFTGYAWYQAPVEINAQQAGGKVHLMFPGLFNECWLYVNGNLVAYRPQQGMWWINDYKFEWDVDLTGKLKPGTNTLMLRQNILHHFGGIFRRPFLYRPNP